MLDVLLVGALVEEDAGIGEVLHLGLVEEVSFSVLVHEGLALEEVLVLEVDCADVLGHAHVVPRAALDHVGEALLGGLAVGLEVRLLLRVPVVVGEGVAGELAGVGRARGLLLGLDDAEEVGELVDDLADVGLRVVLELELLGGVLVL